MSTMKDFLSEAAFSVSIYQVFVTNLSRKSRNVQYLVNVYLLQHSTL